MARVPLNPVSEALLVSAVGGNETAIAAVWRAWNPALLRFFRSRNASEPDDLAQQVWLEVARKLPEFDGGSDAFRRWIFTLAHRRLIDAGRAHRRRPRPTELTEVNAGSGSDWTEDVEGLDWALSLMGRLPDQQAAAVSLRYLAGMSANDVAEVMGKTPGAVRVLIHRGLRRLEQLIDRKEISTGV